MILKCFDFDIYFFIHKLEKAAGTVSRGPFGRLEPLNPPTRAHLKCSDSDLNIFEENQRKSSNYVTLKTEK